MQTERNVHRHLQAATARQHVTATSQIVDPLATAAVVIGIVIDAVRGRIDAVGEACPLQVVARAQVVPGMVAAADVAVVHTGFAQTGLIVLTVGFLLGHNGQVFLGGQGHTADDIALAATHTDSVGGNHGVLVLAQVRNLNNGLIHALGQRESAQIDPHATCHGLIHAELARAAQAVDRIGHIAGTVGQ